MCQDHDMKIVGEKPSDDVKKNKELYGDLAEYEKQKSNGNISKAKELGKILADDFVSVCKKDELTISENGGEAATKTFKYRVATLQIKATNAGQKQTAWVALDKRHVVLRLETPYSFNHGKLVYTLKTIDRTEK